MPQIHPLVLLFNHCLKSPTMPTQAYFDRYPKFPDDIQTAKLPQISYAKLLANDEYESEALFEVSRAMGFFLLDFRCCPEGEEFLEKAEIMFDINEEVTSMEVHELMKYAFQPPKLLFGLVLSLGLNFSALIRCGHFPVLSIKK
jgi:hypothetical protein